MATSLRKICKIVRKLGGCGECELESRCLWSEFQSSQSVCFLALKYFFVSTSLVYRELGRLVFVVILKYKFANK